MARILAYTSPQRGHVYPCAGVLVELVRRGHEVHVRTRAGDVPTLVEAGIRAEPVAERIEEVEHDDWQGRNPIDALERLQRTFMTLADLEVPDLSAAIDEVRPHGLILDVNCEGAGCVAEASGLPWAYYCPYPPVFPSRDAPPYGPGLKLRLGPAGRVRDAALRALLDRVAGRHLPPLNALRGRQGLPPVEHLFDHFLRAPRFVLFTAEPYEYPRSDWPAPVRLVGPALWEPPADPPEWLVGETRPIVLVTASSIRQGDEQLIASTLEGLAGEDVAVVATTAALDPGGFAAPANARVERFVPHAAILERAACVVSHGGQGITQKALAAGVPVCAVPFCRDQFEVARRVEHADAGVRLHHRRLTPASLRRAVRTARGKRHGAEHVAQAFAAAGGAPAAARVFEELLPRAAMPTGDAGGSAG